MSLIRSLAAISALVGGVALLLADSAGPTCKHAPFDRTFTMVSSCGSLAETVRIHVEKTTETGDTTFEELVGLVEHVEGDVIVQSAQVSGTCVEEDDPIQFHTVRVNVAFPETNATCDIDLQTLETTCTAAGDPSPCDLTITFVQ